MGTSAGFRLAMSERGSNGLKFFRIRGPNGITKSPSTLFIFWTFGCKPSLNTLVIQDSIDIVLVVL